MDCDEQSLIDCDVHCTWGSAAELLEYVSPAWRAYFEESHAPLRPVGMLFPQIGGINKRVDSFGPAGELPGSSYERLRAQHLDRFPVEAAILTYDIGNETDLPNPFMDVAIARAGNDWLIDRWLGTGDPRLYGTVLTGTALPIEAAAEIRRAGAHPRMAAVLICGNNLEQPFGHPVFDPIYEAAVETDLPVMIHVGSEVHSAARANAGGLPATRLELHSLMFQPFEHYLTSMLVYGTFERFPELRIACIESGVGWLPWLMMRLDSMAPLLRRESPWIKRRPSDYIREHVRLSTQPFDFGPKGSGLLELLETTGGLEEMLMFASDYPHWDADDPRYVVRNLPADWRPKVCNENARRFFKLPIVPRPAVPSALAG
jgi:predicted TIM-barrel fold metal-dependent hydrolase